MYFCGACEKFTFIIYHINSDYIVFLVNIILNEINFAFLKKKKKKKKHIFKWPRAFWLFDV